MSKEWKKELKEQFGTYYPNNREINKFISKVEQEAYERGKEDIIMLNDPEFKEGFYEAHKMSIVKQVQELIESKRKKFKCGASKYLGCDGDMCCDGETDKVTGYNQALDDLLKEL